MKRRIALLATILVAALGALLASPASPFHHSSAVTVRNAPATLAPKSVRPTIKLLPVCKVLPRTILLELAQGDQELPADIQPIISQGDGELARTCQFSRFAGVTLWTGRNASTNWIGSWRTVKMAACSQFTPSGTTPNVRISPDGNTFEWRGYGVVANVWGKQPSRCTIAYAVVSLESVGASGRLG